MFFRYEEESKNLSFGFFSFDLYIRHLGTGDAGNNLLNPIEATLLS